MQKRIRASEYMLLQTIADLGHQSDLTILRMKPSDLQRNRAFVEHSQRLRGAIGRLACVRRGSAHARDQVAQKDGVYAMATGSAVVPHRAEQDAQRAAFKTLDVHYAPCPKVKKCALSNDHIGPCKGE